jgi:Tat protein secretion system quality control protein TatD with DNase activity
VTDVLVVSEDLDDATKVLALPEVLGGVRLHKALGMHPEKANLGTKKTPLYSLDQSDHF